MSSRPRATALQPSNSLSLSDNSHSSESTSSHPTSLSSSNTSWGTHHPVSFSKALAHIPQTAELPKDHDALGRATVNPNSPSKRRGRVLRKPSPTITHEGSKRWNPFRSTDRRSPSRSPSRIRINLNDDASFAARRPLASPLPPPSAYNISRRSPAARFHSRRVSSSAIDHVQTASEPGMRPPATVEQLRAKIESVDADTSFDTMPSNGNIPSTSLNTASRFEKPLPNPPIHQSRPPLSFRHSSHTEPSEEEQAESLFGHFSSERNVDDIRYKQACWSDVGHGNSSWSNSGHMAVGHASEAHSPIPPYPIAQYGGLPPTSTSTAHSMFSPTYTSQSQVQHALVYKLSLGMRIKRRISLTFSSSQKERESREMAYAVSEPGHGSSFYEPSGHAPSLTPWSQHDTSLKNHRKLKKRTPSVSAITPSSSKSGSDFQEPSASPPGSMSVSGPGPPKTKRSRSIPTRLPGQNERPPLPPLPPLPSADNATSEPTRKTRSQPTTPTTSSHSAKLTKRRSAKKEDVALDESSKVTLPPMRSVSPLQIDLATPRISDGSRSHSAPNLPPWPPNPTRYFPLTMTDSPSSSSHMPDEPMWPESPDNLPSQAEDRPSFLRSQSNRRWTLAVSESPEEQVVEELDRLRNVGWGLGFQGELVRVKGRASSVDIHGSTDDGLGVGDVIWAKEELEEWSIARKALLICREIVRTEKNYRDGLIKLQRGETLKKPPPLLLQYLPALISASQVFSSRLDDDPSAWGVSVAFIGSEDELEVAFVAWSGVVGEFFGRRMSKQRNRQSGDYKVTPKSKEEKDKDRKSAGAPVLPSMGFRDSDPLQIERKGTVIGSWRSSMPMLSQLLSPSSDLSPLSNRKTRHSTGSVASQGSSSKTPTVQDLAIQPTQRVMRYTLLYKDLLGCTPIGSPARVLVEHALEGATRIAQRCNRAQDNAAFLA